MLVADFLETFSSYNLSRSYCNPQKPNFLHILIFWHPKAAPDADAAVNRARPRDSHPDQGTLSSVKAYDCDTLLSQVPARKMEHESTANINSLLSYIKSSD